MPHHWHFGDATLPVQLIDSIVAAEKKLRIELNERKKLDPFHFSEHRLDQQFQADWATAGVEAGCQGLLLQNFKILRLYSPQKKILHFSETGPWIA